MGAHDSNPVRDGRQPPGGGTVLRSWEVRWFMRGAPTESVVRAFVSLPLGSKESSLAPPHWSPSRTDHYLVWAGDMGVKTRQDAGEPARLELKGRVKGPHRVDFGVGASGWAEEWVKWSYEADRTPTELVSLVSAGPRSTPVLKERILRLLRLPPDPEGGGVIGPTHPMEVALGTPVPRGVQIELARVRLDGTSGAPFWSVGLEAFPASADVAAAVLRTAVPLLEGLAHAAGPVLTQASSRSYPAWLTEQDRADDGA